MTKEVEVGDEYAGKVVKTTTFGAFVELAKGTDGLLHISNVSPGERVETVEDVLNKGDEINVRVVEVDRERGRIGLRLADDPDIAGKSVEELAGVGTGGGGGGGGRATAAAANGRDRDRRTADRGRERRARLRPPAPRPRPRLTQRSDRPLGRTEHTLTTLDSGVRVVTERVPGVRSVALGFWIGTGSVVERDEQAGHLAPARAHAVPRHRALRLARRSTRSSTRWAPRSTPAPTRRRRRSTRACSTGTSSAPST